MTIVYELTKGNRMNSWKHKITKLRKFTITNPIVQLFVAKYENIVDWRGITNQQQLEDYIRATLLPNLVSQTELHAKQNIYLQNITIDSGVLVALKTSPDIKDVEIASVYIHNPQEAESLLLHKINQQKKARFDEWQIVLMKATEPYATSPAFQYMMYSIAIKSAGQKNRRTSLECNETILRWMFEKISQDQFIPEDNLFKIYVLEVTSIFNTNKGWIRISGTSQKSIQLLSSLCHRSGWCVASSHYARSYLQRSDFFLLLNGVEPVVALRVTQGDIVECQGKYNQHPTGWETHIEFFAAIMQWNLLHRKKEIDTVYTSINLANTDFNWWEKHSEYLPMVFHLSPSTYTRSLRQIYEVSAKTWLIENYTSNFQIYYTKYFNEPLSIEDWSMALLRTPQIYPNCPVNIQQNAFVQDACMRGWMSIIDHYLDIASVPEFVLKNDSFREKLLPSITGQLYKKATSLAERRNPIRLDTVFTHKNQTPKEIQVMMSTMLIRVNDANYANDIFPLDIIQRDDFENLLENAWIEAIENSPPLYFAATKIIQTKAQQKLLKQSKADIDKWAFNIQKTPSILERKNGVPAGIRIHPRLLEAYVLGWLNLLKPHPYRFWYRFGNRYAGGRVYMSSATCYSPLFFRGMVDIWVQKGDDIPKYWNLASTRMQHIPIFQQIVRQAKEEYQQKDQ